MPIVTVTVTDGNITCHPDPVVVAGGNNVLSFNLVTPGYAFPLNGAVALKKSDPDFPYEPWAVQSSQTVLLDLCTAKGLHAYSVSVVEVATGKVLTVDPGIQNDP